MSGHSKWSTIKRAKGVADAKRSSLFTKLAKAISVAAKDGADPSMNARLRVAIEKARSFSLPKDNIERAIQKGSGSGEGTKLEEVRYEAYGPGGVAFLIDAVTDNHNRTSAEVRHILEHAGGRMGEVGSVNWMFQPRGLLHVSVGANRDQVELAVIEAGALDIAEHEGELTITCDPGELEAIKQALAGLSLSPSYTAIEPVAKNNVSVSDPQLTAKLNSLREALDAHDDVTDFYDNEAD